MSNPIPIRPGAGQTPAVQGTQADKSVKPQKELPAQKTVGGEAYAKDQFTPAKLGPTIAQNLGQQNPLLSLSVSKAIEFLSGAAPGKKLEIAGIQIAASDLAQLLSAVAQQGGGSVTVAEALAGVGQSILQQGGPGATAGPQNANAGAPPIPIQNARMNQAIIGLRQLPPDQPVLTTNAPGGRTQSLTAGELTTILDKVYEKLGASTQEMTVAQALQYVASHPQDFAKAAQKK